MWPPHKNDLGRASESRERILAAWTKRHATAKQERKRRKCDHPSRPLPTLLLRHRSSRSATRLYHDTSGV
jgi:hypothetical protein